MRPWLTTPPGLRTLLTPRAALHRLLPPPLPSLCSSLSTSARAPMHAAGAGAAPLYSSGVAVVVTALREQTRFQRSIPGKPRSSSWREKVQIYDRQQEEQRMAEEAEARRLARLRGGSGSRAAKASMRRRQKKLAQEADSPGKFDFFRGDRSKEEQQLEEEREGQRGAWGRGHRPGSEYDAHHDAAHSNPAAVPGFSFWQSIRLWGRRKPKDMPMNPLHHLKKTSTVMDKHRQNPDAGHVSRFLLAIEELHGRSRRRNEQVTAQLSDDQRRDIVARYAETRWWGRAYLPFKNVSDSTVKKGLRLGRLVIAVCVVTILCMLVLLYKQEMRMISQLTPEDRRDYTHMVLGMRQSDVHKLATEVLSKEDPLYALPDATRCHIMLEEARRRNWDKIDWDVECRNQHPDSALMEGDYLHLLYWSAMLLGNMIYGGSAIFNEQVFRFAEEEREKAHREPGQQMEPTAKPESTKRSFFS